MGVAGYSEMARMLGLNDVADKYAAIAKKMEIQYWLLFILRQVDSGITPGICNIHKV